MIFRRRVQREALYNASRFLLCKLHGFLQNRVCDAARDAAARAGVFRNHDKGVRVLAVVEESSEHRVRLALAAQLGRTRLGTDFQAGKVLLAVIDSTLLRIIRFSLRAVADGIIRVWFLGSPSGKDRPMALVVFY